MWDSRAAGRRGVPSLRWGRGVSLFFVGPLGSPAEAWPGWIFLEGCCTWSLGAFADVGCEGPSSVDPPFIATPTQQTTTCSFTHPLTGEPSCCSHGVQTAGLLSGGETEAESGSHVPAAAPATRTFHAPTAGTRRVPSSPAGPGAADRVPCPPGRPCSGAGRVETMPAAQPDPMSPRRDPSSPRPAGRVSGDGQPWPGLRGLRIQA